MSQGVRGSLFIIKHAMFNFRLTGIANDKGIVLLTLSMDKENAYLLMMVTYRWRETRNKLTCYASIQMKTEERYCGEIDFLASDEIKSPS
ncbi:hypothetical protein ABRP56_20075 [Pectobacterium odoriferum]|uniref:hypothetical protein n=1 Tax=Pectobacterium odoriferum TaxID=78398 RepID=UPI0032EB4118